MTIQDKKLTNNSKLFNNIKNKEFSRFNQITNNVFENMGHLHPRKITNHYMALPGKDPNAG